MRDVTICLHSGPVDEAKPAHFPRCPGPKVAPGPVGPGVGDRWLDPDPPPPEPDPDETDEDEDATAPAPLTEDGVVAGGE